MVSTPLAESSQCSAHHQRRKRSFFFFFTTLKKILSNGTWLLPVIFYSEFLQVPYVVTKYLTVALNDYCEANSSKPLTTKKFQGRMPKLEGSMICQ
jgi:hypothetical protein